MEVLRFVFSDFWIWLGLLILIATVGNYIVEAIRAARPRRKIEACGFEGRWQVKIDGANKTDVAVALQYAKEGRLCLEDDR